MADAGQGLGPITRAVVTTIWNTLFDSSAAVYLPTIIKNGYPAWGLPSYDPATPSGATDPYPVPGVSQDIVDGACEGVYPVTPIATADPTLQLLDTKMSNLSVMSPGTLTFDETAPQFTATVTVGTTSQPFTVGVNDENQPNFLFAVACCEPVAAGSRTCDETYQPWCAQGSGQFTATITTLQVSATTTLNTPPGGPMTVSIDAMSASAHPSAIAIHVDVTGLSPFTRSMVQMVINHGIAQNQVMAAVTLFLNQPSVRGSIETLINQELKTFPDADPRT